MTQYAFRDFCSQLDNEPEEIFRIYHSIDFRDWTSSTPGVVLGPLPNAVLSGVSWGIDSLSVVVSGMVTARLTTVGAIGEEDISSFLAAIRPEKLMVDASRRAAYEFFPAVSGPARHFVCDLLQGDILPISEVEIAKRVFRPVTQVEIARLAQTDRVMSSPGLQVAAVSENQIWFLNDPVSAMQGGSMDWERFSLPGNPRVNRIGFWADCEDKLLLVAGTNQGIFCIPRHGAEAYPIGATATMNVTRLGWLIGQPLHMKASTGNASLHRPSPSILFAHQNGKGTGLYAVSLRPSGTPLRVQNGNEIAALIANPASKLAVDRHKGVRVGTNAGNKHFTIPL